MQSVFPPKRMRFFRSLAGLYLLAVCSACNNDPDRITGRYKVLRLLYDTLQTRSVVKEFGKNSSGSGETVPPQVLAVGHNEDFIIAKRHPAKLADNHYTIDTSTIDYYIVDMKAKVRSSLESEIGPLNQQQFDSLRTRYKIKDIPFDQIYDR